MTNDNHDHDGWMKLMIVTVNDFCMISFISYLIRS